MNKNNTIYMEISREVINKYLIHGDQLRIAKALPGNLEANRTLVSNVLRGVVSTKGEKAQMILRLTSELIERNKKHQVDFLKTILKDYEQPTNDNPNSEESASR